MEPTTTIAETAEVALPLAPVTVRMYAPVGVAEEVEIVSVDELDMATEEGTKLAVAPFGSPFMLSATEPVKPSNDEAET